MNHLRDAPLMRLRPRADRCHVSCGATVLITDPNGIIEDGGDCGLFVHETRVLSRYRLQADGRQPVLAAASNISQQTWLGYYLVASSDSGAQPNITEMAQQAVELRLSRRVAHGMHEHIDIENFTQTARRFDLAVHVAADFADLHETHGERRQQGTLQQHWRRADDYAWELAFDYEVTHHYAHQGISGTAQLRRGSTLRVADASSAPRFTHGRIEFSVNVAPHGCWHVCLQHLPRFDGCETETFDDCERLLSTENDVDPAVRSGGESTTIRSTDSDALSAVVIGAVAQAERDLTALRLRDCDLGGDAWTVAAGIPAYVALFGRDTLATAGRSALLGSELMRGTLLELARWQGSERNDWRDEQPGRMLHEAHRGPLAVLNITPHARYYGSITTSPLYPIVLWEFWRWTADSECVRRLIEPALRALHWLDTDADLDGDGFYEFQTRSEQGLKNQGWKDSSDAIVYADGTQVPTPIATCEAQAFAYAAKRHMAELLWWFGRRVEARELQRQALALRRRFHDVFWMEPEAFVAMALDPQKRPVRSIASDAGHCLGTGIFDPPQARAVADRLLAADLFSGWGIRTLSAAHPAFNPFSYQRGSVWPVENGLIALGLARYGLYDHLHRLCRAHFEAAALFDHWRLPEVFSGHPRDAQHPFPGLYPETNWPQAWSAAAVVSMLDALLGIWPFAPREVLVLDPHLPPWLPQLIVAGLRVGAARVTIEFRRRPDGAADHRVLEQHGSLRIVRRGTSMPDLGCSLEERATALAAL